MDIRSISPTVQPPPPPATASTPADLIPRVIEDARRHSILSYWSILVIVLGVVAIVVTAALLLKKYFTTPVPQAPTPTPTAAAADAAASAAAHPPADPQAEVWIAPPPIAHYFPRRRRPETVMQSYLDQPSEVMIEMVGSSRADA